MDKPMRAEVLEIERLDRRVRADLVERGALHTGGYHPDMQAIHHRHPARMCTILETRGWKGRSLAEEGGCRAAGFVVQHAILDLELQRRSVALLREAVKQSEAEPFMLALLTNRV